MQGDRDPQLELFYALVRVSILVLWAGLGVLVMLKFVEWWVQ